MRMVRELIVDEKWETQVHFANSAANVYRTAWTALDEVSPPVSVARVLR